MSGELWADVHGFEGLYRVSNTGLVASCDRPGGPFKRRLRGRVLRQGENNAGQKYVDFSVDGERTRFIVARLVATMFIRRPHDGEHAMHLDLDRSNNRAENLAWMTHDAVMEHTRKVLCSFEYLERGSLTQEVAHEYFAYRDGELYWKKRPALRVKIGTKAGHIGGGHKRVDFLGNSYMQSRIVYLMHYGVMPNYVLPRNGDYLDCKVENLFECTASEWATISNRVRNTHAA